MDLQASITWHYAKFGLRTLAVCPVFVFLQNKPTGIIPGWFSLSPPLLYPRDLYRIHVEIAGMVVGICDHQIVYTPWNCQSDTVSRL